MRRLLLLLLVILAVDCKRKQKSTAKDECLNPKQIDQLMAIQYTYGNSGRVFPTSINEISAYCKQTEDLNRKLEHVINNCKLDPLLKNMFKILVITVRRESKSLCRVTVNRKPTKRQTKLLSLSPCVNSAKDDIQKCINLAILFLQDTVSVRESRKKIPAICCNIDHYEKCLTETLTSKCGAKVAAGTVGFIDAIQGNMLNFFCDQYNSDSNKCDAFYKEQPVSNKVNYKSLVMPLIDSMNNFDFD